MQGVRGSNPLSSTRWNQRSHPRCGWLPGFPGVGAAASSTTEAGSGLDGRPVGLADAADLDLARLGLLGDRDGQAQDAGVVGRLDPVEVEVVAEHELTAEPA